MSFVKYPLLLVEGAIFGIAIAVQGNSTHFTWWALTAYAACIVIHAVDKLHAIRRLLVMATVASATVSVSVLAMSLCSCSIFAKAVAEHGPFVYTVGNWALHYWPALRLTMLLLRTPTAEHVVHGDAARFFVLYCASQLPGAIYECPSAIPRALYPLAGITFAISFEWAINKWLEPRGKSAQHGPAAERSPRLAGFPGPDQDWSRY